VEQIQDEQRRLAFARAGLSGIADGPRIDAALDQLVQRRRVVDHTCAAALSSPAVLGRLAPFSREAVMSSSPIALWRMVSNLSATEIHALLASDPQLAGRLARARPDRVHQWWASLGDADGTCGGLSARQQLLLATVPGLLGNLGGIPYRVRDAANRAVLTREIADAPASFARAKEARARAWGALPWAATGASRGTGFSGAEHDYQSAVDHLTALRSIQSALGPDTQSVKQLVTLALFDNALPLASISIGDLDTADNVTYLVPGMGTDARGMDGWARAAGNLYIAQGDAAKGALHPAVVARSSWSKTSPDSRAQPRRPASPT
jgi:hypothetical protein